MFRFPCASRQKGRRSSSASLTTLGWILLLFFGRYAVEGFKYQECPFLCLKSQGGFKFTSKDKIGTARGGAHMIATYKIFGEPDVEPERPSYRGDVGYRRHQVLQHCWPQPLQSRCNCQWTRFSTSWGSSTTAQTLLEQPTQCPLIVAFGAQSREVERKSWNRWWIESVMISLQSVSLVMPLNPQNEVNAPPQALSMLSVALVSNLESLSKLKGDVHHLQTVGKLMRDPSHWTRRTARIAMSSTSNCTARLLPTLPRRVRTLHASLAFCCRWVLTWVCLLTLHLITSWGTPLQGQTSPNSLRTGGQG